MIVSALDKNGDWQFGKSINNYISGNPAVKQNIRTRLLSFLGDCFFDIQAGLDWFTYMGGYKNPIGVQINVSSVILNTAFVTGINQLSVDLTTSRIFSVSYQVQSAYSVIGDTFQYTIGI